MNHKEDYCDAVEPKEVAPSCLLGLMPKMIRTWSDQAWMDKSQSPPNLTSLGFDIWELEGIKSP